MPTGELPQTITKKGELPERFANAGQVVDLCAQMTGADQKRSVWRSEIERVWTGEPIYPMSQLRAANQAWRARTNYRGMEGIVSTENTLDYDLETQGEGIVDVSLELPYSQQVCDWERIMEEEFKWLMLTRWKDYNFHVPKRHCQKNLHGLGMHIWTDVTGNWIPRTPCLGEVLFPDNCPFNFHEEGDYFMLRDFLPSYVLHGKIRNEKEARTAGWDVDEVWKALVQLDKSQNQNNYGSMGAEKFVKEALTQGDIGYWTTRQSGVWIDYVFVREYETGKVSQYAIAEGLASKNFLYKKRNKYEQWPIELFPYDIGNSTIHSVKGLGDRTIEFFKMNNRLQNAMVDQIMLSSYPSFKQTVQNMDPDKMKLAKVGGMNWLPYGAEPQIMEYPDLNRGPLALKDDLNRSMLENNRGGLGAGQVQSRDRMTAEEYAMRIQEANRLSTGSVAMQHSHISSFYDRIFRLVCKPSASSAQWSVMAKEFRDRCEKRGVDPLAFKSIGEVKAVLAFGKGSAAARTNAYMTLFQSPAYGGTTDDRRTQINRGFVASLFGQRGVEEYCPSVDDNLQPDQDDSFAVQENNALSNGGDALAAPRQNQTDHLRIHFGKVGEIVEAYQMGQMQPEPAYGAVYAFGGHIKQHLDYLAANPVKKQEYQQYFNQWQALSRIADKMHADIESAAEAEPPEQQMSDKLQIGLANVQMQGQLGSLKANNSAELKMRQQAHREMMDAQKLNQQRATSNAKTMHELQTSSIKTAADIAQDTALTTADIENKNRKAKKTE